MAIHKHKDTVGGQPLRRVLAQIRKNKASIGAVGPGSDPKKASATEVRTAVKNLKGEEIAANRLGESDKRIIPAKDGGKVEGKESNNQGAEMKARTGGRVPSKSVKPKDAMASFVRNVRAVHGGGVEEELGPVIAKRGGSRIVKAVHGGAVDITPQADKDAADRGDTTLVRHGGLKRLGKATRRVRDKGGRRVRGRFRSLGRKLGLRKSAGGKGRLFSRVAANPPKSKTPKGFSSLAKSETPKSGTPKVTVGRPSPPVLNTSPSAAASPKGRQKRKLHGLSGIFSSRLGR